LNPLRRLAGQTAIYGLSSILGRVIGYLLIPLYTRVFIPEEYGVANEMYAYCSILLILLTYGMETTFFRFSESESDRERVYSTSLISILVTTLLFLILAFGFSGPLAELIRHPDHMEYIIWFALIVSMDALTAIPFARLRAAGKATRFAAIKLLNIFFFIGFNLFFIVLCPYLLQKGLFTGFVNTVYNENIGVGYIFISNLIASAITILLLLPEYLKTKFRFDRALWRRMMVYALPLLVLGLAGSINETMDRIFLKFLLPENIAMEQVGIYGACYKISLIMTIFIQAFRFAAEPFFFAHAREADARKTYADVMKYFVIVCALIFLAVMMYMDGVKYFVGEKYYAGLTIVPILLLANLFLGVYFNLSIWYKLTNQTKFGAYISIGGALLTVLLNIWWIPLIGFMGSAWATLICYFGMMVVSYVIGQKHYAVPYDLRSIICYVLAAVALFLFSQWLFPGYASGHGSLKLIVNSALLLSFILVVGYFEKPLVRSIFKLRRS
jgi:O-antigen/teichoic acid export membrane protein